MKVTIRMPDIRAEATRPERIVAAAPSHSRNVLSIIFVLALGVTLAYAVFFLSTPIAQTDHPGREKQYVDLLALGIVGLAQAILPYRQKTRKGESRLLVWLALLLPGYAAF